VASAWADTVCTRSRFYDNRSENDGGGLWAAGGTVAVAGCEFAGNHSDDTGGAINATQTQLTLAQCLMTGNDAGRSGGGLGVSNYDHPSTIRIDGCTFTGNTAHVTYPPELSLDSSEPGGASNLVLSNSILRNILPPIGIIDDSTAEVTYCNVSHGWPGEGTIDVDPAFVDPDGPDGIPGTADDNYRLRVDSPCRNAGSNAAIVADLPDLDGDGDLLEPIPMDLDGNPRVVGDRVDMGAYERPYAIGDFDHDDDVDLDDYMIFETCLWFSGPGFASFFDECVEAFDHDDDTDIDLSDFAEMQRQFTLPLR
jgi:predicted outer membrane repeat protein